MAKWMSDASIAAMINKPHPPNHAAHFPSRTCAHYSKIFTHFNVEFLRASRNNKNTCLR